MGRTLIRPPEPRDVLAARVPRLAADARRIEYIGYPELGKNLVVRFDSLDASFVLKVYTQPVWYTCQTMMMQIPRYLAGSFCLRAGVKARIESEKQHVEGFRRAGLRTFEIEEQPTADSLLMRAMEGRNLEELLHPGEGSPDRLTDFLSRAALELTQRQRWAERRRDLGAIHPQPRLKHILIAPDGELVHFDFEDQLNPSIPLESLLALEVETFFGHLCRLEIDGALLEDVLRNTGEDVLARWASFQPARLHFLLKSARRRRRRVGEVLERVRRRHRRSGVELA